MKNCFTLLFAVVVTGFTFAQTVTFFEDFETGIPSDWTIRIVDDLTVDSAVIEFAPGWIGLEEPQANANHVAGATSYFDPIGRANRWLITPPLTLSSFGNILSWRGLSHDPSWPENYLVLISTSGTEVEDFTDTLLNVSPEGEEWTARELNLSDSGYNSGNVHIAFVLRTYNGFKLYLDDVELRIEDPVGIDEDQLASIIIYPNPSRNQISVKGENILSVSIIGLNGQLLLQQDPDTDIDHSIDISNLDSGVYFADIKTDKGTLRRKFVKL